MGEEEGSIVRVKLTEQKPYDLLEGERLKFK